MHSPIATIRAITQQLEELKQLEPEWDGPGTIAPQPAVVDRTNAWITEHWCAELGYSRHLPHRRRRSQHQLGVERDTAHPRRAVRRRQRGVVPVQS